MRQTHGRVAYNHFRWMCEVGSEHGACTSPRGWHLASEVARVCIQAVVRRPSRTPDTPVAAFPGLALLHENNSSLYNSTSSLSLSPLDGVTESARRGDARVPCLVDFPSRWAGGCAQLNARVQRQVGSFVCCVCCGREAVRSESRACDCARSWTRGSSTASPPAWRRAHGAGETLADFPCWIALHGTVNGRPRRHVTYSLRMTSLAQVPA